MRVVAAKDLDLAALIGHGAHVVCGQACGEPLTLLEKLVEQRSLLSGTRVFIGASFAGILQPEHGDHLHLSSFGALGTNRNLARAGVLNIVPCHVGQLGRYFSTGVIGCDVLLVQLGPASADGVYGFGAVADYIRAAAQSASLVIAEINDQAPRTSGEPGFLETEIDVGVFTSRALPSVAPAAVIPADLAIAHFAAGFIGDGAVLQMGIGALPDAILRGLAGLRDLGIHSGMISDVAADLIECGAVTNATKPVDVGISVTGALIGTERLYRFADANPLLSLRGADYTHAEATLSQFDTLVTINGALEVDLSGQVNAEQIGDHYVGAVGGQADFVRAGHRAARGRAIIALQSTARGGASRIVPQLTTCVTTARSDVDIIVTEYGAAELRGRTLAERSRRMIAIAHPDHREALSRSAHAWLRAAI